MVSSSDHNCTNTCCARNNGSLYSLFAVVLRIHCGHCLNDSRELTYFKEREKRNWKQNIKLKLVNEKVLNTILYFDYFIPPICD